MTSWDDKGAFGDPEPTAAPYDAPAPYGAAASPAPFDGLSIAALVCSLTCCAAPVGLGLGIAGVVRTKGGRRRGRGLAVSGVVLGALGSLALVGALVGLIWVGVNTVPEDEARAGQCVDLTAWFDEDDLWKASCDEPHDAEIVDAGPLGPRAEEFSADPRAFCRARVRELDLEITSDPAYEVGASSDASSDDSAGPRDSYACYLRRADGGSLDRRLLDYVGGPAVS